MIDWVNLSGAVRSNLLGLQQTSGLRVRDPLDGAADFFASQALGDRAQDLSQTKDGVDQALSTILAANNGLDAISDLTQQVEGLTRAARNTSDPTRSFSCST